MNRFMFSAADRRAVAEALSVDMDHRHCDWVERIVNDWLEFGESQIQQELERNKRIRSAAQVLLDELIAAGPCDETDEDREDEGDPSYGLEDQLDALIEHLHDVEQMYGAPRAGRKGQIPRRLSVRLIEFWEHSGRRVARSSTRQANNPDKQDSSGPLVRFLLAAVSPVLQVPPTADAAAAAIRNYQEHYLLREEDRAADARIVAAALRNHEEEEQTGAATRH